MHDHLITMQQELEGWLRFRRLLCLRQHVTTIGPKSAFWAIFDPTMTLTLDLLTPNLMRSSLSASDKSLVKFRQQIPNISCWQCLLGSHGHARMRTNTSNIMPPAPVANVKSTCHKLITLYRNTTKARNTDIIIKQVAVWGFKDRNIEFISYNFNHQWQLNSKITIRCFYYWFLTFCIHTITNYYLYLLLLLFLPAGFCCTVTTTLTELSMLEMLDQNFLSH